MVAAIYARKSTEQTGVADEQKSVARQIDHAREYASRKGWTAADDHVYVDDGISGAEFANRPAFLQLINALKPKAPFQVLVVSELSRLGREQFETGYAVKQFDQAGVRIYSYLEDKDIALGSAVDKFLMSAVNFAAEIEREKARQRVYDAMLRKARAGHVTGGRTFGYDNVEILGADGKRSHVERRINEAEAAVIRRIFILSAAGTGFTRIAKMLNADRALSPRAQRGRSQSWAPTSVKEALDRELYRGNIIWNRTKKRDSWGQKHATPRAQAEWLRHHVPALQIIDDDLWSAARGRLSQIRVQLGPNIGRRRHDVDSRHLLAGFGRCAVCGGSFAAMSRAHGGQRVFRYGCASNYKRGITVCDNALQMRASNVDEAVLETLGGKVLRPAVIMAVLDGVFAEMAPKVASDKVDKLREEIAIAERSLSNLSRAIATGGPLEALLAELKTAQVTRDRLVQALHIQERMSNQSIDRAAIERQVLKHVGHWRTLLSTKHVADGRQLLRECLTAPISFTPEKRSYQFEGEVGLQAIVGHVEDCHVKSQDSGNSFGSFL